MTKRGLIVSYIRNDDYSKERERPKLISEYFETAKRYIKLRRPALDDATIDKLVRTIVNERYNPPKVEAVLHKGEGQSELVKGKLDNYVAKVIKDNNLSPSGTCYAPVSRKPSFLRASIEDKVRIRYEFKKKYLDFEAQGKKRESQYYNQNQANAKIFNNAIAGGMKIKQFILGCKAGFNAITSVGRLSVKQAYSYVERAVNSNLYLPSADAALSYVLNHVRHIHPDFPPLIEQGVLVCPTVAMVTDYLMTNVANYTSCGRDDSVRDVLENLTPAELAYVYYAGCFNNLCRTNEELMRGWINRCFPPETLSPEVYQDLDPGLIKSFPSDVIACVLSTNYRRLGLRPGSDSKWNTLKDAAVHNPDGLRAFIYACQWFEREFQSLLSVIKPVMQIQTTFGHLLFQHRMARHTVPLSDTDSNIFSTQELIRWKCGKIVFDQEAYEMNALVVFIISQSLEHVFARLSAGFGAEGKDVFRISMKNEFLYPVLLSTALAKHYMAIATMQEGSLLPHPRRDIKGVELRSSKYPKIIRSQFEDYIVDLFALIQKGEPILASSILGHVAQLEHRIHSSVRNRESDYLQTVAIKRKEEYADPDISSYFYYELWKAVFSQDYGEMQIPNKCYKIPLKGGKRLFRDPVFLEQLKLDHPIIHDRLIAFTKDLGNRDITYLLIPPFKGKIHPFFLEIMDVRAHISQVLAAYYHVLDALGIGTTDVRVNGLVSDFCDPSQPVLM